MTPSKLESLKSSIALSEARYHKVNEKVQLVNLAFRWAKLIVC